jgi:hypothetical protein
MKLATVRTIGEDRSISIPSEMAEVLGFEDGTTIYFHLIESIYYTFEGEERGEYKVLVSSINPQSWPKLHNLEFSLGDEPGSLATLMDILGEKGISVQLGESRTTLYGVRAELSVVAEFRGYENKIDHLNREIGEAMERNPALRRRLKPKKVIGSKEIWVTGELSPLHEYTRDIEYAPGMGGKPGRDRAMPMPPGEQFNNVQNGRLILPNFIIRQLNEQFGLPKAGCESVTGGCCVIMVGNFDTKLLTLTFPQPGARLAQIVFHIKDEPGAMGQIARFLWKKSANLLETRVRTLVYADHAVWKVITDLRQSQYRGYTKDTLVNILKEDMEEVGVTCLKPGFEPEVQTIIGEPVDKNKIYNDAYRALLELELELRQTTEKGLATEYGEEDWWDKEGIPPDIRQKVEERRQRERYPWTRSGGRTNLEYVDFADYIKIITKKGNWDRIFSRIFPDKEIIISKLRQLEPIRNRIAHANLISENQFKRLIMHCEDILDMIRDAQSKA